MEYITQQDLDLRITGAPPEVDMNSSALATSRNESDVHLLCVGRTPSAAELFQNITTLGSIILPLSVVFAVITVVIFIIELGFVIKYFHNHRRRSKTLAVLAVFPVYSVTSLLALWIPRSAILVDLIANVYFGICIYNFTNLMVCYQGGRSKMVATMEGEDIQLATPPLCCCFRCLPIVTFSNSSFRIVRMMVLQTALIKPILMLTAAVLWADGLYNPANMMNPYKGAFYIQFLNIFSTLLAMYGLVLLMRACRPHLLAYSIRAKFMVLQVVLLSTMILSVICGLLVRYRVVECVQPFDLRTRAWRLYHVVVVFEMLLLSIFARRVFLRPPEYNDKQLLANGHAEAVGGTEPEVIIYQPYMDSKSGGHAVFVIPMDIKFADEEDSSISSDGEDEDDMLIKSTTSLAKSKEILSKLTEQSTALW